jgi:hypothetical protein
MRAHLSPAVVNAVIAKHVDAILFTCDYVRLLAPGIEQSGMDG